MSKVLEVTEKVVDQPAEADALLRDTDVQDLTSVPTGTLRWWRHQGNQGPKWFRLGPRAIRYKRSDVLAWVEEHYKASQAA